MKSHRIVLIAVTCLLLLSLGSYLFVDEWLFARFLEQQPRIHENDWLSPLRELGKAWLPIWLLLLLLLTTKSVRPALVAIIAIPLIIPLVTPTKFAVGRQRPAQRVEMMQHPEAIHTFNRGNSSFPSGDTATAFAVATALTPYLVRASAPAIRGLVPLLFGLAGLVGTMRVTVMKHYVSDVLAGAAFGLLAGYLAWRLIENHPNLRPHLYLTPVARAITLGLVIAIPFLAAVENVNPLELFLRQYGMLVLGAAVAGLLYTRRNPRAQPPGIEPLGS